MYNKIDYGKSEGVATKAKFVPPDPLSHPGNSDTVQLDFVAQSTQGFDLQDPGIILFEHPNYIGNSQQFSDSQEKIDLPTKYWVGVSSFIIHHYWRQMGALCQGKFQGTENCRRRENYPGQELL